MRKVLLALSVLFWANPVLAYSRITKEEVLEIQDRWAEGIVKISQAYVNNEDYKAVARKHIEDFTLTEKQMFYSNQL